MTVRAPQDRAVQEGCLEEATFEKRPNGWQELIGDRYEESVPGKVNSKCKGLGTGQPGDYERRCCWNAVRRERLVGRVCYARLCRSQFEISWPLCELMLLSDSPSLRSLP